MCGNGDNARSSSSSSSSSTHTAAGTTKPTPTAAVAAPPKCSASSSSSLPNVWRQVYQREGVRGFYRGLGIAATGSAPGVALYITSYQACKDRLTSLFAPTTSNDVDDNTKRNDERSEEKEKEKKGQVGDTTLPTKQRYPVVLRDGVIHLASGVFAEAVSCVFWVPIDVIKERCQSQGPDVRGRYRSSYDAFKCVAQREGFRGIYKGYYITVGSFGPFSAVYFAAYELLSASPSFLRATTLSRDPEQKRKNGTSKASNNTAATNFYRGLFCGLMANVVACVATNPLEMIKTRIQVQSALLVEHTTQQQHTQNSNTNTVNKHNNNIKPSTQFGYKYGGMVDGLCQVAKEEGVRGLWRGLGARIAYSAPNAALTFGLYSLLKGDHSL